MTDDFARAIIRLAGESGAAVVALRVHGEAYAADRLQAAIEALGRKPKERDDG